MTDPSQEPSDFTRVLLAVGDLFFRVKLEAALRQMGIPTRAVGTSRGLASVLDDPASVVVLDLSDAALEPLAILASIAKRPATARPVMIGFAPHVDEGLRRAAREAGCDVVVSRGRIASRLPELLAPYLARLGPGALGQDAVEGATHGEAEREPPSRRPGPDS